VPVAVVGTFFLPTIDLKIKPAKLRGAFLPEDDLFSWQGGTG